MSPHCSSGEGLFAVGQVQSCRQLNPATVQTRTDLEQASADRGETEIAGYPHGIIWLSMTPLQPSATGKPLPEERHRARDLVVLGKISPGQLYLVPVAGDHEAGQEPADIEIGRTAESQKGEGWLGAHGRQIGEVDGQQSAGNQGRVQMKWKMNSFNLVILGDSPGSSGWENGAVVTKAVETLESELLPEPLMDPIFGAQGHDRD